MSGLTVVFGNGAVGHLVTETCSRAAMRCASRSAIGPGALNGAQFIACDILDTNAVRAAVDGASQVVLSVGFPYDARVWRTVGRRR